MTLRPSSQQVFPEPFGPTAIVMPGAASGMMSGRIDPQLTNCASSICGISGPVHPARPTGPRRRLLALPLLPLQPLVAEHEPTRLLGCPDLINRVHHGAGGQPPLTLDEESRPLQLPHADADRRLGQSRDAAGHV